MKINKVLYLLRDRLENLPPSMSQILTLCQLGLHVKVVTTYASDYIRDFLITQVLNLSPWKIDICRAAVSLIRHRIC